MSVSFNQLREDRALARRVVRGDDAAFTEFFNEYFSRLYRFALTRVGDDPQLAEEVVQRTMCRVVRKLSSWRGEALLFTWLCQICRNEMASLFRQRGVEAPRSLPLEDNPAVQAALESMLSDDGNPETSRVRADLARFVRSTLDQLPARYATALEMKYIRGCSVDEIATALAISGKAAESVLTRARNAFREGFRALHDLDPGLLLD